RENFNLYYVGIFVLDSDGRYAVLRAGTGDAGEKMIEANHRLEVGGASMIGWCVSNRQARIALDVGAEQVRFNNPYLPLTRSEMALPIVFQDRSIGAMTIQSVEPRAFVEEDILILQGIADSLAIALENATLFQNTQQALEELRVYNQNYIQDTWGRTLAAQGDLSFSFQNQSIRTADNDLRELSIPVTLRDQKIGEISIETANDTLSADDRAFLDAILTQTALALENARLLEETQRRAIQEQKLNDLSTQLSKASSIEYILQTAARELGQLPMVSEVSVQLVSSSSEASPALPGSKDNSHNGNGHNGNGKEQ
ncbi:sensor histidine kinase, partial [bacterium]|nr:sensor histidine kinase [bacterium]